MSKYELDGQGDSCCFYREVGDDTLTVATENGITDNAEYTVTNTSPEKSRQRIDRVKAIIGAKFCTLPKRMWAIGILRGLYCVHNHELEPITFTEMNALIDYVCGDAE